MSSFLTPTFEVLALVPVVSAVATIAVPVGVDFLNETNRSPLSARAGSDSTGESPPPIFSVILCSLAPGLALLRRLIECSIGLLLDLG